MTASSILRTAAVRAARASLKQARGVRHLGAATTFSPSITVVGPAITAIRPLQVSHFQETNKGTAMACLVAASIASITLAGNSNGTINTTRVECQADQVECVLSEEEPSSSSSSSSSSVTTFRPQPQWTVVYQQPELEDKYAVDFEIVLGQGSYGSVHPALIRETGQLVALKKISRRYTSSAEFENETSALLRIYEMGGHPNINRVFDMFEDDCYFYVVLEFVPGGEMLDHVVRDGAFGEADAARLMRELASALMFLHKADIVHADLKPENILLSSPNRDDGAVKLIDFGCAVVGGKDDSLQQPPLVPSHQRRRKHVASADSTGTTAYWAPERFNKGLICDAPMDMWSAGVLLYIMLVGLHPYDLSGVSTDADIREKLCKDPTPPLGADMVGHLSPSAVDLLSKMLETDPSKRMTASEVLEHPWVVNQAKNDAHHTLYETPKVTTRSSTYIMTRGKEMSAVSAGSISV